jgi:hypothetical protein
MKRPRKSQDWPIHPSESGRDDRHPGEPGRDSVREDDQLARHLRNMHAKQLDDDNDTSDAGSPTAI